MVISPPRHKDGRPCTRKWCLGPRGFYRESGVRGGDDDGCYTLYENWQALGMPYKHVRELLGEPHGKDT